MTVSGEIPVIQSQSGERSFTVSTESVSNLPISGRNWSALTALDARASSARPAWATAASQNNNIMMDGVAIMDTGNNGQMLQTNVEAIAEVKILTSGYQAEYGRASGLQITAVTKSGTNQFRGSVYDIERNSDWNANSWVNEQNGDPKAVSKQRDWGYTIGGPVGKPGGANKLFFFYGHEYRPRTTGGDIRRFRVPTALERAGDFSQSTNNNGALVNLIRDAVDRAALHRRQHQRLLPGGRRARPDSAEPPLSDRPEHPQAVARAQRHRAQLQLRERRADRQAADAAADGALRLPGLAAAARDRQVHRPAGDGEADAGHDPRLQRHAAEVPVHLPAVGDGQLQR